MMDQSADTTSHGRVGYGRIAKYTPAILAAVMIIAIALIALSDRDKEVSTRDIVGQPAPALQLIDFETGLPVSLATMQGQVVVLNFWASWCVPCEAEMPAFEAVHQDGTLRAQIVGVNIKNDRVADARELLTRTGVTYDIAIDTGGDNPVYGPIEQALGLGGSYPVTVFIRPNGEIDAIRIGELEESQIRAAIADAES